MNPSQELPSTPLNSIPINPKNKQENLNSPDSITEHVLLNSSGFAIILPDQSPLFISFEPNNGSPLIRISVDAKKPYQELVQDLSYLDLKFTIITGNKFNVLSSRDSRNSTHSAQHNIM